MDGLQFRNACQRDVSNIVELVERAYRGDASRRGWTTEADLLDGRRTDPDEVSTLLASGNGVFLLGEEGNALRASLWMGDETWGAYLGMIAVSPVHQGRGLGRALLEQAELRARATGTPGAARHLRMTVIAQRDDLIAWYQRRGFAPTGDREPFPYGQLRFGLPKRPDLYFIVLEKRLT